MSEGTAMECIAKSLVEVIGIDTTK